MLFVDYGNTAKSVDLRILPDQLLSVLPTAIHCALQSSIDVQQLQEDSPFTEFIKTFGGNTCHFQLIDTSITPSIVRMFSDPECVHEILATPPAATANESSDLDIVIETIEDKTTESIVDDVPEEIHASTPADLEIEESKAEAIAPKELIITIEQTVSSNEEECVVAPNETITPAEQQSVASSIVEASAIVSSKTTNGASTIAGTVCWINSSADFYLQPSNRSDDLDAIANGLYETSDSMAPLPTTADAEQICAAHFADDEQFYRAKIIARNPDDSVTVFFVDFGNKATTRDLRTLPDALHAFAPCAIQCSLAAGTTLDATLSENEFQDEVSSLQCCYIQKVNDFSPLVRLFRDAECLEEISIAATRNNAVSSELIDKYEHIENHQIF